MNERQREFLTYQSPRVPIAEKPAQLLRDKMTARVLTQEESCHEQEFAERLRAEGHVCVRTVGDYIQRVYWCGQKPCAEIDTD